MSRRTAVVKCVWRACEVVHASGVLPGVDRDGNGWIVYNCAMLIKSIVSESKMDAR